MQPLSYSSFQKASARENLHIIQGYLYTTTTVCKSKFEMLLEDEFVGVFDTMPQEAPRAAQDRPKTPPEGAQDDQAGTKIILGAGFLFEHVYFHADLCFLMILKFVCL